PGQPQQLQALAGLVEVALDVGGQLVLAHGVVAAAAFAPVGADADLHAPLPDLTPAVADRLVVGAAVERVPAAGVGRLAVGGVPALRRAAGAADDRAGKYQPRRGGGVRPLATPGQLLVHRRPGPGIDDGVEQAWTLHPVGRVVRRA